MKIEIANIYRGILHNFRATWGISIKFSGKMWLMIILKVTKNHPFFTRYIFRKTTREGGQIDTPSAVLGLIYCCPLWVLDRYVIKNFQYYFQLFLLHALLSGFSPFSSVSFTQDIYTKSISKLHPPQKFLDTSLGWRNLLPIRIRKKVVVERCDWF